MLRTVTPIAQSRMAAEFADVSYVGVKRGSESKGLANKESGGWVLEQLIFQGATGLGRKVALERRSDLWPDEI